jgi:cobalt-zinc-cadmium efflux system outer membrane protein
LQAGLPPNPTFGYSGQQLGSRGLAEQQGVMIGQKLITGGKLRLNREVMAREIQVAQRNYEAQRLRVRTDITLSFVHALSAQQRAELAEQLARISRESITTAESLLRANEGTRIEYLQAKLEAENTHILSQQARYHVDATWHTLTNVIGLRGTGVERLSGDWERFPPPADFESVYAHLEQCSPEIAAARAQIQRARWDYQLARRERIGDIDVQGLVQRDEGVNLTDGAVQISMPLPVWDRKQGRINEACANIAAAEQAEQKLRAALRQKLAEVYENYQNANHQIEHYTKEILPSAEEHLKLVNEAKRAGELNYTVVLLAQRTLAQARLAYLDAHRERALAASQIQGMLLQDSLQSGTNP